MLNIDNYVKSLLGIYQTSMGLALLAIIDEAELPSLLKTISKECGAEEHVGPDGKCLLTVLQEVRGKGYALGDFLNKCSKVTL